MNEILKRIALVAGASVIASWVFVLSCVTLAILGLTDDGPITPYYVKVAMFVGTFGMVLVVLSMGILLFKEMW